MAEAMEASPFRTAPLRATLLVLCAAVALAACDRRDQPLPGQRIDVRAAAGVAEPSGMRARPISLPTPVLNADWSYRTGAASGRPAQPALAAAPQVRWSAPLGAGDTRRSRLMVAPVVSGGLVFAMDANGLLSAFDRNGSLAWTVSLIPEGQRPGTGPGGGMSAMGGVLYVTTGYGQAMALDPRTGGIYWRRQFEAPIRSAPVARDGRVILVLRDDTALALQASDGATIWEIESSGGTGLLGGATPAVEGSMAVIPFASGEVRAVSAASGQWLWGTAIVTGPEALARNPIVDISGDPVISGDAVFTSSQNGRTIRVERATGTRLWTMPKGAYDPVWPVGGSLFLVSDESELVRADASLGEVIWTAQLPKLHPNRNWFGDRMPSRAITHFGPILAGGKLWVASGDGMLRGFSPVNGALLTSIALPGPAAAPPAVAGGVMYVVTTNGLLNALQ
jgi:outer membrane protein assembly factor BamB